MPPELAKPFYESFLERVRKTYNPDTVKGSSIILNNLFYFYVSLKSSCLLYFLFTQAFDYLLKVFSYILHNSIIWKNEVLIVDCNPCRWGFWGNDAGLSFVITSLLSTLILYDTTLWNACVSSYPEFFGKSCLQRWLSGYVYNFCVSCTKWAGRLFDIEWAVNLQVHLVNDGPVTMNLDSRKTSNVDSDETVGTQKMWVSSQTWNVQWCPHY